MRFRIVVHAFIDGYSCLVLGVKASNNNRADTILELFPAAKDIHGMPSRVRGDHGVENLKIALWMEEHNGRDRGSYIT